jgi:hypothetical protein
VKVVVAPTATELLANMVIVGAPDTVAGVTADEALEAFPVPTLLVAVTVKV